MENVSFLVIKLRRNLALSIITTANGPEGKLFIVLNLQIYQIILISVKI